MHISSMRLLLHGLNYAPELTGIGKYTGELARFLAARGHAVRVVCAPPYYPHWRVGPGYHAWQFRREWLDGVEVLRAPLWVPRRPAGLSRLLHLASFALGSTPWMLSSARWQPQVVFAVAPAIFAAPAALMAARRVGIPAWLHIQDFELDAAAALGMLPFPRLTAPLAAGFERRVLAGFQRVSTISPRMLERLHAKGLPPERTLLFPNWVDTEVIAPLPGPSPLRGELGIPPGQLVVLYAGNLGRKHGLEVMLSAARLLVGKSDLLFVICGEGAARPDLERAAAGLANLRLLPLQPPERLNDLLNLADIHLLPERADAADLVMPSKLGGMLASARPVVAAVRPGSGITGVVEQVGVCVPPEQPAELAAALLALAADPTRRAGLGAAGRQYVKENWESRRILLEFEQRLQEMVTLNPLLPDAAT